MYKWTDGTTYLMHHGIKGQKWGVRRFQNEDGSYTAAGKARYDVENSGKQLTRAPQSRFHSRKKTFGLKPIKPLYVDNAVSTPYGAVDPSHTSHQSYNTYNGAAAGLAVINDFYSEVKGMTDEEFAEWAKQNMGSVIGIGIDMGTFGKQDALNLLKSYAKGLGEALAEGGTYMPGGKSEEKFVESFSSNLNKADDAAVRKMQLRYATKQGRTAKGSTHVENN